MAGVHAYDYIGVDFIESNNTDTAALTYGLVYVIDFVETAATWDCSLFGEDLNRWMNDLSASFAPENNPNNQEPSP